MTVERTEAPGNIGPSTLSRGKQLYPRSRGKIFPPPNPAAAIRGFKSLRRPQGDSSSDFSSEKEFEDRDRSDNQSHAEEGKTPEGEEDDDEDTLSKKSNEASQYKAMESHQKSSRDDRNNEDGDDFNPSSDGEPSESTGKANDVVPDSVDNIGTDSHREDFIHDQNLNFDLGSRGGEDDLLESSNNVDEMSFGNQNMFGYMETVIGHSRVPDSSLDSNIGDSSAPDPFLDSNFAVSPVPRRTSARKRLRKGN